MDEDVVGAEVNTVAPHGAVHEQAAGNRVQRLRSPGMPIGRSQKAAGSGVGLKGF